MEISNQIRVWSIKFIWQEVNVVFGCFTVLTDMQQNCAVLLSLMSRAQGRWKFWNELELIGMLQLSYKMEIILFKSTTGTKFHLKHISVPLR